MDDDELDTPEKTYPLSPSKMSKAPSWAMLGFLVGAAFVWSFKRETEKAAAVAPVTLTAWPKAVRVEPSPITTIETLFAEYGRHAVWHDNLTEIAMWRSETRDFSEFYEVKRVGEALYFRSIPKLTRLVIHHGVPLPNEVPLRFTETEEQYREWLEHGRFERQKEATVQPSLLGPALIPPGETMPRVQAPQQRPSAVPVPVTPEFEKPKLEIPPKS